MNFTHTEMLQIIFAGTGVQITPEGRKYLGGYVGTRDGAVKYVNELMEEWLEQLREMTKIAKARASSRFLILYSRVSTQNNIFYENHT